ncbi:FAD-binding oxidoreductase [Pseudomonas sp. AN-1]|uniref:iron-sulfur cluster-binding protein n=1 Tax=Pseudomonas sp. AN-1 TaxID=3096605 RepID=UPI002A6ACB4E|nr:FAD-binding oxidoreductase [Pseudomonas sp. AN-1]WPP46312.1 FAD-binding oxidoreductase [Pseudomonas sp. AN-1]
MLELTPRPLRLLGSYADGRDARHFRLRLEQPLESDRATLPGQFFMLGVPGQGEAPFTYVSAPDAAGEFSALIRRSGRLTARLFELEAGALLGYRGPFGRGWPTLDEPQAVLVVAGGCGLAPLAGWIAAASERPELALRVLYGARSAEHQVLGRERARWRSILPLIETLDEGGAEELRGSPLGQLDRLCAETLPHSVLCCGPEAFMLAIAKACVRRGVAAERIWLSVERRMHCAVGLCGHCYIADSYACVDGPTYRYDQYRALLARGNLRGVLGAADVGPC